jgi:hypothetical protein
VVADNFPILSRNVGAVAFDGKIIIIRGPAYGRSAMKPDPLKSVDVFGIVCAVIFAIYGLAVSLFGEDELLVLL